MKLSAKEALQVLDAVGAKAEASASPAAGTNGVPTQISLPLSPVSGPNPAIESPSTRLSISRPRPSRQQLLRPPPDAQRLVRPALLWDSVLGADEAKRFLQSLASPPFDCVFLLFGPPGCGKTMIASAAATDWNLRLMTVWGTELHSPFSKSNTKALTDIVKQAQASAPCLLLLQGLDPILAPTITELRAGLVGSQVVMVATSSAAEDIVSRPVTLGRLRRTRDGHERQGRPGTAGDNPVSAVSGRALDDLACFDKLLYVGPIEDPITKQRLLLQGCNACGRVVREDIAAQVTQYLLGLSGMKLLPEPIPIRPLNIFFLDVARSI